jgi:hypothetical protein
VDLPNTIPRPYRCTTSAGFVDLVTVSLSSVIVIGYMSFDSLESSVGMAIGYRLEDRGSIQGMGKRFSSSPQHPDWPWGPSSLLNNGYQEGGISSRVKRPERKADYSAPSTSEVNNSGAIPPLPQMPS